MSSQRTHHVTTSDGVTIGATVDGHGPPLVLLQGIIGDGDLDWQRLVPHLTERFTCHRPSIRGRGLSGDHANLAVDRIVEDYRTYVESLGEPTALVGWSAGANHALAVAARSEAVSALAPYEPVANTVMDDAEQAALVEAVTLAGQRAAGGDLTGAMRAFAAYPLNPDDIAAAEEAGYFEATARYVPNLLAAFQGLMAHEGPLPDDPAVLRTIVVPTMVLHGSESRPFFTTSAHHVADHVADGRVQTIDGAGHAAPLTHPASLASELRRFLTRAPQSA